MTTTVIYHSADYDGIFCREIAKKFLPSAELIGWNFGDKPLMTIPGLEGFGNIIVMDLPVDAPFGVKFSDLKRGQTWRDWFGDKTNLTWIDHHKTSIDTHPRDIPGYRIDGVAACRLAWQWFNADHTDPVVQFNGLPAKDEYVNRNVKEPLAVRLAGLYDIWDKRDPRAETFQYALRCANGDLDWKALLANEPGRYIESLLEGGTWAQRYGQATDASTCKSRTWLMEWEGLKFLCVNSARFNSLFFSAKDVPETGHDALLGFCYDGKCWTVSLYHAKHRTDLDLSEIAKRHGGGGHRGACGFTSKTLPFSL